MIDYRKKLEREERAEKIGEVAAAIISALVINPVIVWAIWNYVVPSAFGWPRLTFWQVWLLMFALRYLRSKP